MSTTIKSDRTLLNILHVLKKRGPTGISELADETNVSKGTAYKHVNTMREEGYVVKQGKKYDLGFKFLSYVGPIRGENRLCNVVREKLRILRNQIDELVGFGIREGDRGFMVYVHNDDYGIQKRLPVGTRFDLYGCAEGKAILSKFSNQEVDNYLTRNEIEKKAPNTITSGADLRNQISETQSRGYSVSLEEQIEGINAIGAPVVDSETEQTGAVVIAGPIHQLDEKAIHNKYSTILLNTVEKINLSLKYKYSDN